jgi:hypothetical protein
VTLRELLATAAADLDEARMATAPDGAVSWSCAGEPFAVLRGDGAAAEFRLDSAVAAAAARTPDTSLLPRGPGWVLFQPAKLDAHGSDRATAWFVSAYRRIRRD